jgi:hypothetical protein
VRWGDHLDKLAGGLMAAAFVTALGYGISYGTSSTSGPGPATWPFVLCGAMFALGALLYGGAHGMLPWQKSRALRRRADTAESALETIRAEMESMRADLKEAQHERDEARRELADAQRALAEAQPASHGRADMGRLAEDFDRLSRQINEYRAERVRAQPGYRFPTAKAQDGQHRQWVNNQAENEKYRNETSAGFQQKFATDISRLWHAAKEAGIVGDGDFPEDRVYIEIAVTNERGMDRIADVLAELGRRAKTRQ